MEAGEGDAEGGRVVGHLDENVDEYQLAQDEEVVERGAHAQQERAQSDE